MFWFFLFILACSIGLNAALGLVVLWHRFYLNGVKQIVLLFIRKQNHDRCWWYPELFEQLRQYLRITEKPPAYTISRQEFESGCARFADSEFGPKNVYLN